MPSAPRTFEWSQGHIQSFCDHLRTAAILPASDLRPFHLVEWVESKPTWGANQKRGALIAVSRPFNWAAKLGYIDRNPVSGVEKPAATKRESLLTPGDFAAMLALVKDVPFRSLLAFAWETGVRPQEARHIEARHLQADRGRIEIPPAEAKGKRRWRVIYLSMAALKSAVELAAKRPVGPLFLNTDGRPWKAQALVCRFQRLKKKLGKRFAMYDLRHCFATRKLKEGIDPITVSSGGMRTPWGTLKRWRRQPVVEFSRKAPVTNSSRSSGLGLSRKYSICLRP